MTTQIENLTGIADVGTIAPIVFTTQQVIDYLQTIKGARFARLVVETEPPLKGGAKSPVAGLLKKRSEINVCLNHVYGNSVNNQRAREEGENAEYFEPAPRKWGMRIRGTTLVLHKDNYYLEVKVEKVYKTQYYLDNVAVAQCEIEGFLQERNEPERGGRQDVERPVILRDYKLSSVREIYVNGEIIIHQYTG